MESADLRAVWTVLETAATGSSAQTLQIRGTGLAVDAGEVLVGIDSSAHRHLLLPLKPGEAFAEDRAGRGVQLRRVDLDGVTFADVICLLPSLNIIFERLCREMLQATMDDQQSPARALAEVLRRWKELLAAGSTPGLGNEQLIGLLAELVCLESILEQDERRRVDVWTGPIKNQHDFVRGPLALEVKAISSREGRVVSISSIDQLEPPPRGELYLSVHRFQSCPPTEGITLPKMVSRVRELGVDSTEFNRRLLQAGYSPMHDVDYQARAFRMVEQVVYDTRSDSFPAIRRSSFVGGDVPVGTLHISYSIDLTNQPPIPLGDRKSLRLFGLLAA